MCIIAGLPGNGNGAQRSDMGLICPNQKIVNASDMPFALPVAAAYPCALDALDYAKEAIEDRCRFIHPASSCPDQEVYACHCHRQREDLALKSQQPSLGSLLRNLRTSNDWTLKEMSDRTGIPVSTLSKVEHDRLTLTYDKLLQISQRLNLRMSELFSEPASEIDPPITARRSIGRLDEALRVNTPNYDYYYLCTELRRKRMVPLITRVRAKGVEQFGALVHHAGEEYIYVLEGPVEIHTEFYDPVVLQTGQSMYLDSTMGHAYVVPEGQQEAVLLAVCASGAEDLQESLLTMHDHGTVTTPAIPSAAQPGGVPAPRRSKRRGGRT